MNEEEVFNVLKLELDWYKNYDKIITFIKNKDKEIARLSKIIKETKEMLEKKVDYHEGEDSDDYYNYLACLRDMEDIIKENSDEQS